MSRPHEEFEMLTAFAAANQLSDRESDSLQEHLQSCAACRLQLAQMNAASYAYFAHHSARPRNTDLPAEVSERFSQRLASLGISPSSPCLVNPAGSLRVATAALAFAILAPAVAGLLASHHRQGSSAQTEMVPEQSVSESHVVVPQVFNSPGQPETRARHRRSRHSAPITEASAQSQDLDSAEEQPPHFRLEYPPVFRRTYPKPFAVPSVPSFPLPGLGKTSNGAKTFELASLLTPGQSDSSDGPNALRYIAQNDPAHPGSIATRPQFHLPPLPDGSLFSTDMRH